ncbi:hypothetical protein [Lacipirellula sp.]|uniref:hypothetical protein n=1 Tax=Lacipirellula sp. TaxID=2691419 RepID=UPI003D135B0B
MPQLQEVFGIGIELPLSYVERQNADGAFKRAIKAQTHLVIHGGAKQGKTCLRKRYLPDAHCNTVHCSPSDNINTIYAKIIRNAGVAVASRNHPIAYLNVPSNVKQQTQANIWRSGRGTVVLQGQTYEFPDAQSLCGLLSLLNERRLIVLENFHYLAADVQKRLAFDLKTFHELGVRFLILGVWKESNKLQFYNRDLSGRLSIIPVEPWHDEEFDSIIDSGAELLNITIREEVRQRFKNLCFGNVGILHELLRVYCQLHGVDERCLQERELIDAGRVDEAISENLQATYPELIQILQALGVEQHTGNVESSYLNYYIVRALIDIPASELRTGVTRAQLLAAIRDLHHFSDKEQVTIRDTTEALGKLRSRQQDMSIPFVEYDTSAQKLNIVDHRHLFVLSICRKEDILAELPYPL